MNKIVFLLFFAGCCVAVSSGFGLSDVLDYLLGGYGQYGPGYGQGGYGQGGYGPGAIGPGHYPGHYPGNYPGNHPGHYPGHHPPGPPGAHPGCPLCDSSVYDYCSYKESHDSCCCEGGGSYSYGCRKANCRTLYANSCKEYNLISSCCCVDLHKNAVAAPVAVIAPVV